MSKKIKCCEQVNLVSNNRKYFECPKCQDWYEYDWRNGAKSLPNNIDGEKINYTKKGD